MTIKGEQHNASITAYDIPSINLRHLQMAPHATHATIVFIHFMSFFSESLAGEDKTIHRNEARGQRLLSYFVILQGSMQLVLINKRIIILFSETKMHTHMQVEYLSRADHLNV